VGDLLDFAIDEFSIEGPTVFLVTGCVWTSTGLSLELAAGVRQSWAIADDSFLQVALIAKLASSSLISSFLMSAMENHRRNA